MDSKFEKVYAIKRSSHRSWNNFREAAKYELENSGSFGTEKVKASSVSYLNKASEESGLTVQEILDYMDKYGL